MHKNLRFMIDDPYDSIQEHLAHGRFYEQDELEILGKYVKQGWTIIDIGAHVGSHTIYFDRFFNPKVVYAIEPLPRAYALLLQNVALNYAHTVNVDHIGIALGDTETKASVATIFNHNFGATTLRKDTNGTIPVVTGDSIFSKMHIDLIKLDAEKMEMEILDGFEQTISASRPLLFIEVDTENKERFAKWCIEHNYSIIETTREHIQNSNYIVKPSS